MRDVTCVACKQVFLADDGRPFCFTCLPAPRPSEPMNPRFVREYRRLCRAHPVASIADQTDARSNTGGTKRTPKVRALIPRGVCRDCGTTEGMDWSAHIKGAATGMKTRCRKCYNAYCAAGYQRRKAAGLAAYTYVRKQRPVQTCATCQAFFETRGTNNAGQRSKRCEPCQYRFDVERRGEFFARRRKVMRMGARDISWQTVGERDGWTCHLCAEPVKQSADSPHDPQSPTVDHIVPIAAGGKHEWSNVALAHWLCNVTRGAKLLAAG